MQLPRTRRRALAVVIGLATAVSLGVVVAGPAEAASVHIVRPGQSIQAAVDAANPGDTIRVLRGTYQESVSITTSDISLVGARDLQSPGDPLCGVCVGDFSDPSNTVTGVSVSGFTVTGFEFGIFVFAADQTSIRNNVLEDNAEYGVFANSSTNTTIVGNTATGSTRRQASTLATHPTPTPRSRQRGIRRTCSGCSCATPKVARSRPIASTTTVSAWWSSPTHPGRRATSTSPTTTSTTTPSSATKNLRRCPASASFSSAPTMSPSRTTTSATTCRKVRQTSPAA